MTRYGRLAALLVLAVTAVGCARFQFEFPAETPMGWVVIEVDESCGTPTTGLWTRRVVVAQGPEVPCTGHRFPDSWQSAYFLVAEDGRKMKLDKSVKVHSPGFVEASGRRFYVFLYGEDPTEQGTGPLGAVQRLLERADEAVR